MTQKDLETIAEEIARFDKYRQELYERGQKFIPEVESSFNAVALDFPLPEGVKLHILRTSFYPLIGYKIVPVVRNSAGEVVKIDGSYAMPLARAIDCYKNSVKGPINVEYNHCFFDNGMPPGEDMDL